MKNLCKIGASTLAIALLLGAGRLQGSLELVQAKKNGSVAGLVKKDEQPVANQVLVLTVKDKGVSGRPKSAVLDGSERLNLQAIPGFKVIARTTTDQEGKYRFENVKPGGYFVMTPDEAAIERVKVDEGKEAKLDLVLP